jgi:hypothetical protein
MLAVVLSEVADGLGECCRLAERDECAAVVYFGQLSLREEGGGAAAVSGERRDARAAGRVAR